MFWWWRLRAIVEWIRYGWDERRRRIDIQILWPACKEKASTLPEARMAFAAHAFMDPAWNRLSFDEIERRIQVLI